MNKIVATTFLSLLCFSCSSAQSRIPASVERKLDAFVSDFAGTGALFSSVENRSFVRPGDEQRYRLIIDSPLISPVADYVFSLNPSSRKGPEVAHYPDNYDAEYRMREETTGNPGYMLDLIFIDFCSAVVLEATQIWPRISDYGKQCVYTFTVEEGKEIERLSDEAFEAAKKQESDASSQEKEADEESAES